MKIGIIITLIIVIALVAMLVWQYNTPTLIKWYFGVSDSTPIYALPEGSVDDTNMQSTILKPTVYKDTSTVIVWFHGGAFMYSDRRTAYGMLQKLAESAGCDVFVFNYPVRFKSTAKEAMLRINQILGTIKDKYLKFHAGGFSAGVLYMCGFYNKESSSTVAESIQVPQIGITFDTLTGVNGVWDVEMWNKTSTTLFKRYLMKNTPNYKQYTVFNTTLDPSKILLVDCKSDFLYPIAQRVMATLSFKTKIFDNPALNHGFPQYINLDESKQTTDLIAKHIAPAS